MDLEASIRWGPPKLRVWFTPCCQNCHVDVHPRFIPDIFIIIGVILIVCKLWQSRSILRSIFNYIASCRFCRSFVIHEKDGLPPRIACASLLNGLGLVPILEFIHIKPCQCQIFGLVHYSVLRFYRLDCSLLILLLLLFWIWHIVMVSFTKYQG